MQGGDEEGALKQPGFQCHWMKSVWHHHYARTSAGVGYQNSCDAFFIRIDNWINLSRDHPIFVWEGEDDWRFGAQDNVASFVLLMWKNEGNEG